MSETSLLQAVLPRHGPKRLARLMGVPLPTARHWFYNRLSAARRAEIAARLLDELDRQDRERAELRRALQRIAER